MNRKHRTTVLARAAAAAALVSLASCGGGGSGGDLSSNGGLIGGTGVKGPVAGATVSAYAIGNGAAGSMIGTATADANGNFTVSIGSYAGPVMLQLAGGSYTDEATGSTMPMAAGDVMTAVVPSVAANSTTSGIEITPLTSMAQTMAQNMSGGMTDANIASANGAIGAYFKVSDIVHVRPMNPLVAGSGSSASQDEVDYGMVLAAMSQYAHGQGMVSSSALVTAMMSDAADGVMDGKMSGSPVMMGGMGGGVAMPVSAGTSGLAAAMSTFAASARNQSGVPASTMQPLIDLLDASDGRISAAPTLNGMVRGTAFDGAFTRATVSAYAVVDGTRGAQIASGTTDSAGHFSLSIGGYSGPLMLQLGDGTFTDEATGSTTTMPAADVMTAAISNVAAGSMTDGVWITPLTSMAQARAQAMSGGMTEANIMATNASVGRYFMVSDIVHTQPIDPSASGSAAGASQDMLDYGMTIAAMSQYAKDIGTVTSSAFVTAMTSDASDGMMDGKDGAMAITMPMGGMMGGKSQMQSDAGTSGMADAMAEFLNSSANRSGATPSEMAALMQQLMASSGRLP
jgi:hypothetical protein